jgi:hypothetical protein
VTNLFTSGRGRREKYDDPLAEWLKAALKEECYTKQHIDEKRRGILDQAYQARALYTRIHE